MSGLAMLLALSVPSSMTYQFDEQRQELTVHVQEDVFSTLIAGEKLLSVLPTTDQGVQLFTVVGPTKPGNPAAPPPGRASLSEALELGPNGEIALELTRAEMLKLQNGGELRFKVVNEKRVARRFAIWLAPNPTAPATAPPLIRDVNQGGVGTAGGAGTVGAGPQYGAGGRPGNGTYADRTGVAITRVGTDVPRYQENPGVGSTVNPNAVSGQTGLGYSNVPYNGNQVNAYGAPQYGPANPAPISINPTPPVAQPNPVYATPNYGSQAATTGQVAIGARDAYGNLIAAGQGASQGINNAILSTNGAFQGAGPTVQQNLAGGVRVLNDAAAEAEARARGLVDQLGRPLTALANGYAPTDPRAGQYGAAAPVQPNYAATQNYGANPNTAPAPGTGYAPGSVGASGYGTNGYGTIPYSGNGYANTASAATNPATPNYSVPNYNQPAYGPQPGIVQPGIVQPGIVQPGIVQPTYGPQPGIVQPGHVQPGQVQPGTAQGGQSYLPTVPNYGTNQSHLTVPNLASTPSRSGGLTYGQQQGQERSAIETADSRGANSQIRTASLRGQGIVLDDVPSGRSKVTIREDAAERTNLDSGPADTTGAGWIACLGLIATNTGIFWLFRIYQIRYRGLLREMRETGNLIY
jgi:hypothetical protein